jgi:OPA family glycerol-3-phosphate transporter-like MFS transporter/OPA family sugar phosphate sensor protein UhpC-like MFS transporter
MGIWNTSHGVGAAAIVVLCGFLIDRFHDWRLCFFVPAALAIATSGLVLMNLRDTPASVGLPPVPGTGSDDPAEKSEARVLARRVFSNPYIWLFSIANFFVYVVRYAVFDWGPTLLKESKGTTLTHASWMMAGFEIAGVIGTICAAWMTDRFFRGRGARISVICTIGCAGAIVLLWRLPAGHLLASTLLLMAVGFFIYAPQAMIGICVANLATKEAAATAVGLTGLFGYASTVVSGYGMGWVVQHYGWDWAFVVMLAACAGSMVLFVAAWHAPRDGYGGQVSRRA